MAHYKHVTVNGEDISFLVTRFPSLEPFWVSQLLGVAVLLPNSGGQCRGLLLVSWCLMLFFFTVTTPAAQ